MTKLHVHQAQLDYVAVFAVPAFPLWENVPAMLGGLYSAFDGLHSGLADLSVEGSEADPLGRKVLVSLGAHGSLRVGYDRIEASTPLVGAAPSRFRDVLVQGDAWLRTSWSTAAVHTHYLTFSIHAGLDHGTSVDYLRSLGGPVLTGIGDDLGTGVIFHVAPPVGQWQVHLTLDHSPLVEGGLFVEYVVTIPVDQIEFPAVLTHSDAILVNALASVGLSFGAVG
jgi:hypothetical protein